MAVCSNGHDSASDDFCDVCGMRIVGASDASQSPGSASLPAYGTSTGPLPSPADVGEPCPRCGTARSGQFCEACGYNFASPQSSWSPAPQPPPSAPLATPAPVPSAPSAQSASSPPSASSVPSVPPVRPAPPARPTQADPWRPDAPAAWTAVVSSDQDYYERARAAGTPDWADVQFPAYCAERRFRLTGNQMQIGRRSVSQGLNPEIDLTGPPADPGISRLHAVLIAAPDGSWTVLDPGSANGTLVNGNEIPAGNQVPLHDGDRINLGAWTAITVHRG